MNTKLKIAICTAFISVGFQMHSQVGIGVATPNAFSILDLTQTGSGVKGVLLPIGDVSPNSVAGKPEALIIYYQDQVYVKQAGGFNAMNPWKYKFNGNTTEDLSFNPTSLVGVGIGVNTGKIYGRMHISATGKQVTAAGNSAASAALYIGDTTGASHMIFDADEIMVKNTNLTGGLLKLQEEDGSILIGSNRTENVDTASIYLNTKIGTTGFNKNLTVYGNVDAKAKIKENGNDLLPTGSIIAFYGAAVPAGWALCDGTNGTPNLSGRTIISVGSNGETTYTYNTAGGDDNKQITSGMIPDHTHSGNTNTDGAHQHTNQEHARADNDDNDGIGEYIGGRGGSFNNDGGGGFIRSDGSAHSHAFTSSSCTGCGTTKLNVVSKHYVLRYIMKL